ncbi:MAG: AraC family ligand binding domain-containing protein [Ferruginibacter sp.]
MPQNIAHSYGNDPEHPWSIYWIHFGGDALPAFNETLAVQRHFKPFHIRTAQIQFQFSPKFIRLCNWVIV